MLRRRRGVGWTVLAAWIALRLHPAWSSFRSTLRLTESTNYRFRRRLMALPNDGMTVAELAERLRGQGLKTNGRTDEKAGHMLADLIEHLAKGNEATLSGNAAIASHSPSSPKVQAVDPEALLAELLALDGQVSKEDYFDDASGHWDLEGVRDDLRLAKEKAASAPPSAPLPAAEPATSLAEAAGGDEAEALFVELLALDGAASKEDYFDASGNWDLDGVMDDLRLAKEKASAPPSAPLPAAEPATSLAEAAGGDEAEALFVELLALDGAASKEDYFDSASGTWDIDGLMDDLGLAKAAKAGAPASAPLPAAEPAKPPAEAAGGDEAEVLLVQLLALDGEASKEDYFDAASGVWDMDGLQDDLRLAKGKVRATTSDPSNQADSLLAELRSIDSTISKEDYFDAVTGAWDMEGLQDDLRLAQASLGAVEDGEDGTGLLAELRVFDDSFTKEDYFDADTGQWDIEGLQDDLRLAKERAKKKLEASHAHPGSSGQAENGELLFQRVRSLSPAALQEDYMVNGQWDLDALKVDLELQESLRP
ncbi:unnamed protein product [Durusdinium trenchii]|uniref:SAP domain-containing protein n=2 Tax=Durusdinium trenchii TaxID=1381693 RepID=A0ABP0N558_9DINO